ncbi:hypothetical protein ACRRTK_011806 [Alexandromys fortis]
MDKLNKITVPASQKLRQLQKMVHDIKNNEGGIMDKIKKLKVKGPPSVPRRDYALDSPTDEEERWSDDFDSDYENPDEHSDSEMYVMPAEETGDDSYEPPPAEQQTRVVHPALPFTRGEYVDNRSSQRHSPPFSKSLPSKPSWPPTKTRLTSTLPSPTALQKPQIPPKPKDLLEDEADYVVPVEDNDENYIHPREGSPLPTEKGRNSGVWDSKSSLPAAPSPLPRAGLHLPPHRTHQKFVKKSLFLLNVTEGLVTDKTLYSHQCFLPRRSLPIKSLFLCQEAELHGKPWYAGACDRKSAEEALHRSNKYFGSVVDIIKNHQHNPLVLIDSQNNTKDSTRLKYPVKVS